ncbi:hypothetical protein PIB30_040167 [Stylosanthes scabra]|uniref:Uncharacterized protein n=1 Tax=Stylosanthes scabra TaxID=79078 RepID=A0ABU6XEP0_9FABA|nr:hypothetical protein [Stylosanthes scabra]
MWATPCYRLVMSDLISQVGSPDGMWAIWVRSAFCVAWLNGPSKIGLRWAPSFGLEVGPKLHKHKDSAPISHHLPLFLQTLFRHHRPIKSFLATVLEQNPRTVVEYLVVVAFLWDKNSSIQ